MEAYTAYHVVTDRPMEAGQRIVFDEEHRSGLYGRVMEKLDIVKEIYAHPERYDAARLEHHVSVAMRELALEEVRRKMYPAYPSRMRCLYVSDRLEEAEKWAGLFVEWGRPTYHIVKLRVRGGRFEGDANNCFRASLEHGENLRLAERYWRNAPGPAGEEPIREILADGMIEVLEIVKEIGRNLETSTR